MPALTSTQRGSSPLARRLAAAPALVIEPFRWWPVGPINPDFHLERPELAAEVRRMKGDPVPLSRPVVVLGGWRAWPTMGCQLALLLARLTSRDHADFLPISYCFKSRPAPVLRRVLRAVEERWPSDDPARTREVDVIAISMGGLVAALAALAPEDRPQIAPDPDGPAAKRLRVRRLFTLGTPWRGAKLAELVAPDDLARRMRPGSTFLEEMDAAVSAADYEIVCYAVLNDTWVGATRTSPVGIHPIWTPGAVACSHFLVSANRLIVADIARRLRGEAPIAGDPSPPPRD